MTAELGALVCTLRASTTLTIDNQMGEAVQQLFFDSVRKVNPALSQSLHGKGGHQLKAYSVSGLHQPGSDVALWGKVQPGDVAWLRLVGLRADVVAALDDYFVGKQPAGLQINRQLWVLESVTWEHEQHPWAGTTTYEALIDYYRTGQPQGTIDLKFASPTAFRSKGMDFPLPAPRQVFGSLERQWRALSGFSLPMELNPFLDYLVAIKRCRIDTHARYMQETGVVGFSGQVSYEIAKQNRQLQKDRSRFEEAKGLETFLRRDKQKHTDLSRAVSLLASFGFYSGVGQKTTQGMGMVRPD